MWDPVSRFEKEVLPNGLRVYFAVVPDCEIQSIKFIVHAGSMRDPEGLLGAAHFVEHIVSSEIDTEKLEELFDEEGGDFNLGSTNRTQTKFSFTGRTLSFPLFFDIFSNMLMKRRSFASGIEKERGIIQREFQRKFRFKEEYKLEENETKALYDESHLLSRLYTTLGTPETIAKISDNDLCKFHQLYYIPQNISIITIGGLSENELFKHIESSLFADERNWNVSYGTIPEITEMRIPSPNQEILKVSDFASFNLNAITFSATTILPGATNLYSLLIFRRALYRKLFKKVREERSWAYSIRCPIDRIHCCAYEFMIESNDLSLDARDQIIPVINECIQEIKNDESGFKRIQRGFINDNKLIDLNIMDTRDSAAARLFDFGSIITADEIIEKIGSVTFADVQHVCDMMDEQYRYHKFIVP